MDDESFQAAVAALDANVRREAERQGLSLAALAERVPMSRPHLHDVLAGRKLVRLDVVARIADALGLEPWELIRPPK